MLCISTYSKCIVVNFKLIRHSCFGLLTAYYKPLILFLVADMAVIDQLLFLGRLFYSIRCSAVDVVSLLVFFLNQWN